MAFIDCATHGNASPTGKARVFFTCHPEDFDRYFQPVCQDLFQAQDCAVYFTPNMAEPMTEEDRISDLCRSQLLVVPVTKLLLTTPNRAMDEDIPFAIRKNVRILPLLTDPSLRKCYSREDKFGRLQYLSPFSQDPTQIPYPEKLKKHLQSVLVSDELVQKIRGTFSAYMFLSYRKKDRKLAKSLIELIHRHEKYRSIAIWFDEFLDPGRRFDTAIDENLAKSKFFALLVTPNLIEAGNYAMDTEYRKACEQKDLLQLPVEMEKTDLQQLAAAHPELPQVTNCADPTDEDAFHRRLQTLWEQADLKDNTQLTPWEEYLIGMAYTEGIDMETDRDRGVSMIHSAADREQPEAMQELAKRYADGIGVPLDPPKAEYWASRYLDACRKTKGDTDESTIEAMAELGCIQMGLLHYKAARDTYEQMLHACRQTDALETYAALEGLAESHRLLGQYSLAQNYLCQLQQALPEGEPTALHVSTTNSIAMLYQSMGMYPEALEHAKSAFNMATVCLGTEHPFLMTLRENLALVHGDAGQYTEALSLLEENLTQRRARLPKNHRDIYVTVSDLGKLYGSSGDLQKGLSFTQEAYDQRLALFGPEDSDTLTSLNNLAMAHRRLNHYREALELSTLENKITARVMGATHPETLISQSNLAMILIDLNQYREAGDLVRPAYKNCLDTLGPKHPHTRSARSMLAETELKLGNFRAALQLLRESLAYHQAEFGENHPETLAHWSKLGDILSQIGTEDAHREAEEILSQQLERLRRDLPPEHPGIYSTMNQQVINLVNWGKLEQARDLQKQLYDAVRTNLGERHPMMPDILCNLSRIYTHLGNEAKRRKYQTAARKNHEQAVDLAQRAYNLSCRTGDPNSPESLDKLNALAVAQGELGDYKKAAVTMARVYDCRCRIFGKKHLATIESLSNLAAMQGHRRKDKAILEKDREVHAISCELLGESHPTSIRYLDNLANTLHDLGEDTLDTDRQIYLLRKQAQGLGHPETWEALYLLQANLRKRKDYAQLVELAPDAMACSEAVYGKGSEQARQAAFNCAMDYFHSGDQETWQQIMQSLQR